MDDCPFNADEARVSISEAARLLGLPESTVRGLIRDGSLSTAPRYGDTGPIRIEIRELRRAAGALAASA